MKNSQKIKIWKALMIFGNICGCHQISERSFFINNYQLPVCARCLGVGIGYILALISYKLYQPNIIFCICLMAIMLLDWGLQFWCDIMSNNIRRLLTGILCGYGFMAIILKMIGGIFYGL